MLHDLFDHFQVLELPGLRGDFVARFVWIHESTMPASGRPGCGVNVESPGGKYVDLQSSGGFPFSIRVAGFTVRQLETAQK